MSLNPLFQSANIVVLGKFNPSIFHPAWFATQNLIRTKEAEAADVQIVHPEASIFQIDWCEVHVVRERFQVGTLQEPYFEPLRDLTTGVFSLLSHTPVQALGINKQYRFRFASEKIWHAVGDRLAPKDVWQDVLDSPGTRHLTIEGRRPDQKAGHIHVLVEPYPNLGINIQVNDHYELSDSPHDSSGIESLITILSENWDESMKRSDKIAKQIAGLGDTV